MQLPTARQVMGTIGRCDGVTHQCYMSVSNPGHTWDNFLSFISFLSFILISMVHLVLLCSRTRYASISHALP